MMRELAGGIKISAFKVSTELWRLAPGKSRTMRLSISLCGLEVVVFCGMYEGWFVERESAS